MKKIYQPNKPHQIKGYKPRGQPEQVATIEVNLVLSRKRGQHPSLAEENQFFFSHIGHGGLRGKKTALDMQMMGVKPGIWDFMFMKRDGSLPMHWIEMKHGKNNLTDEQKNFRDVFLTNGHTYDVCYGAREAMLSLEKRRYIPPGNLAVNEFNKWCVRWPNGLFWPLAEE